MLSGSLGTVSLAGLVQLLAAERRTGRLEVEGGELWLDEGRVVHARCRDEGLRGLAAVAALVKIDDGAFSFEDGVAAPERDLDATAEQLLVEAATRSDHAERAVSSIPEDAVVQFAPVAEGGSTPRFDTLQWRVLAAIDGRRDVAALARELELPVAAVASVVATLLRAGAVELE